MASARKATAMTVIDLGGRLASRAENRAPAPARRTRLLYEEVIDLVERLVIELKLAPGDLLPTQAEIAERAGVSLITVRRGLDELEREGRVRRHQGVGTFLAHPKIVSQPTVAGGLSGTLAGHADSSRIATTMLGIRAVAPNKQLAQALQVKASDQLWQVRRLRLLRGAPMIIETALIPTALAPGLDEHQPELLGSLYELLATRYGLEDDYEEQYLEVDSAGASERQLLKLPTRTQVVRIRGVSVHKTGVPFDCFEQVYPAANFVFKMSGSSTSRQLLSEPVSRDWAVREITDGDRR
jgi:DNA-binding GntR family transcriptional regulator